MSRAERRAQKFNKPKLAPFAHQEKRWDEHVRMLVKKIYAAVILELHRKLNLSTEEIQSFMTDVQNLWLKDGTDGFDILKTCLDETGINLKGGSKTNAST